MAVNELIRERLMSSAVPRDRTRYSFPRSIPRTDFYAVDFLLRHDIFEYCNYELDGPRYLTSALVLCGTEENAFATTCVDYLTRFWPRSGKVFMDKLIELFEEQTHDLSPFRVNDDLGVRFTEPWGTERHFIVQMEGTMEELISLAEQLAWLTATFRVPQEGRLLVSDLSFDWLPGLVEISTLTLLLARSFPGSCWHDMFAGTILANGFQIPERQSTLRGVELPFEMMTALGLIWYPISYSLSTILKGHSTALVPTKDTDDSVQWHFFSGEKQTEKLDLKTAMRRCWPRVDHYSQEYAVELFDWDIYQWQKKRAFVGYFEEAELNLGTKGSGYDKIQISKASLEKRGLMLSRDISVSVGTEGMGIFGIGFGSKITYGRTVLARLRVEDGLTLDKLRNSVQKPALLYDVGTKRGWLVPEISTILHLCLTWASNQDDPEELLKLMPFADVKTSGGQAAYSAIVETIDLQLPVRNETGTTTKMFEVVKAKYRQLCFLKEKQVQEALGARRLRLPGSQSPPIYGYEFLDVARSQEFLRRKSVKLDVERGGPWYKITSENPDMVVLFCENLGEPIRACEDQAMCQSWRSIPPGKCYLIALTSCLRDLAEQKGENAYLMPSSGLYCVPSRRGSAPTLCNSASWPCCDPVFELTTKRPEIPPVVENGGAVIIGGKRRSRENVAASSHTESASRFGGDRIHIRLQSADQDPSSLLTASNPVIGACGTA